MTGAGSATVACRLEDEYLGGPATEAEWFQPGLNITVGDLSVQNALERIRNPDDPTPIGSREGNFEGAANVSFTLAGDRWHDLVFADGGTALPNDPMFAPSAEWYFGVDMIDDDDARVPGGATVVDATINYQQGADVTVDLTIIYGDELDGVIPPDTIDQPTEEDVYTHHGTDLDVDAVGQTLMQSASLSLSGLARFRRGASRHPFDAVVGAIEPSLTTDATYTETDQLELAYGGTTPDTTIDKADATLTFENGLGETLGYNLSGLQPTSYAWSDLVNPDTDLGESIDYHVADVGVV